MHLIISILAALLGSLLGSAVRGVVTSAQARFEDTDAETVVNVSVSPVAALVGGVTGSLLGSGTAFWTGAVLGAAGMDRLDARLLGQVGVDMDALMAKAVDAAAKARQAATDAMPADDAAESVESA